MINIAPIQKTRPRGPRQNNGRSPGPVYTPNKKGRILISHTFVPGHR